MFSFEFLSGELERRLADGNRELNGKGVFLEALRVSGSRALIFVYRKAKLQDDLRKNGVAKFLSQYGYQNGSASHCIAHLKRRFARQEGFPHEIGIFLGYPLGDVIGFIENAGQCSKYTGCWKVYCDEREAMKLFEKYKKCSEIYERSYSCGRSVAQLTVAA